MSNAGPANDGAPRAQIGQAFALMQQGRMDEAGQIVRNLLAQYRGNAEVSYLASEYSLVTGELEAALGFISVAVEAAPGQLPLLLKKANALLLLRRRRQAREVIETAAAVVGNEPRGLAAIGQLAAKADGPLAASNYYQQALAAGGTAPSLLHDLAAAQFFIGQFEAAEDTLDRLLVQVPNTGHALYLRSTLRSQTVARNHVAELQAQLQRPFSNAAGRAAALYALAKELEDIGGDEASFAALSEGAAVKRGTLDYDAAAERAAINAIRETYSAEVMADPVQGHAECGPIFIVGMPRTGTTLVERILDRHSQVESAGELLDFTEAVGAATRRSLAANPGKTALQASLLMDFAALGRDYIGGAREAARGSQLFVDKMPINFMYCGLIRKALPEARIIHLVRNPMDSGYAIYKTLFHQAYHFSYQLDELADYYVTYHQLMRHWHAVMPGAILDVHYEALVADPEAQARRILEWCSLEWEQGVLAPSDSESPAVSASAAQARQPIHTGSVEKWRRFASGLEPLRVRLGRAGVIES